MSTSHQPSRGFPTIILLCSILLTLIVMSFASTCDVTFSKSVNSVSPNTGLVLWPDTNARTSYKGSIALEFSYFHINDIIDTTAGVYNWKVVDDFLTATANNGHSGIVRFIYEDPNEEADPLNTFVPKYIKNSAGYSENSVNYVYDDSPPAKTRVVRMVDWSSQTLRDFHLEFFTKVAERYDTDSRLAYLQVGFGWWCEYHLYNPGGEDHIVLGKTFPSYDFQKTFLKHIQTKFTLTPYSISIDAYSDTYTQFATDTTARDSLTFGLFDDSFMNEGHEIVQGNPDVGYNEESWIGLGAFPTDSTKKDRRSIAPAGGEVSYYETKDQKEFLLPKGLYGRTFKSQAEKYQLTYMIANDAPSNTITPEIFKENSMMMGYEFSVILIKLEAKKSTTDPNGDSVVIVVKNTGISAPYHQYNFVMKLSSSVSYTSDSIDKLPKGEVVTLRMKNVDKDAVQAFFTTQSATPTNDWLTITSPKVASNILIPFHADCTQGDQTTCEKDNDCDFEHMCVENSCVDTDEDYFVACTSELDCLRNGVQWQCKEGKCTNGVLASGLHLMLFVMIMFVVLF